MTADGLRAWLDANGFKIAPHHADTCNACKWYAYRRTSLEAAECECNDGKRMQIVVWPYELQFNGHTKHTSCEVDVCGEAGGRWFKLRAYGIDMDSLPDKLPGIERDLIAAWNAIERSTP